MDFNDLSDELKAKARECASADELVKLAQEEGIELSDEQLSGLAGGSETEWVGDCLDDLLTEAPKGDVPNLANIKIS